MAYNAVVGAHARRIWRNGSTGWAILAAGVLAWNASHAHEEAEMLSQAFARGMQHPTGRFVVGAAWAILTLHLFDRLPDRYDPLSWVGHYLLTRGAE